MHVVDLRISSVALSLCGGLIRLLLHNMTLLKQMKTT